MRYYKAFFKNSGTHFIQNKQASHCKSKATVLIPLMVRSLLLSVLLFIFLPKYTNRHLSDHIISSHYCVISSIYWFWRTGMSHTDVLPVNYCPAMCFIKCFRGIFHVFTSCEFTATNLISNIQYLHHEENIYICLNDVLKAAKLKVNLNFNI